MFGKKTNEDFHNYRIQVDPILANLETTLSRLSAKDNQIAGELTYAESNNNPLKPIGEVHLGEFQRYYQEVEGLRNEMSSLTPSANMLQFQAGYVKALDKCLESITYRVKTCEYIISGDLEEAEKALLRVKPLTDEFKRMEDQAINSMRR